MKRSETGPMAFISFILRAGFYLAAVAAFTPAGFHMSEGPLTAQMRDAVAEISGEPRLNTDARTGSFCDQNARVCEVGQDLGAILDLAGAVANDKVADLQQRRSDAGS